MATNQATLEVLVKIRDEASGALSRLSNDVGDLGGSLHSAGTSAGILAGAMSAIASSAIINALQAFGKNEDNMLRFEALVSNLPPKLQVLREKILEIANKDMLRFGISADDAAIAMVKLLRVADNPDQAFKAYQLALDLSAAKGIELNDAVQLVVQAFNGQGKGLRDLGIAIDDHMSKETILENGFNAVGGAMDRLSTGLNAHINVLGKIGEAANAALGSIYAPMVIDVVEGLRAWVETQGGLNATLEKFYPILEIIAAILIGVVVGGFMAAAVAAIAFFGVFGTAVAIIAAVVSALILFFTAWQLYGEDIRRIWNVTWDAINAKVMEVWDGIVKYISDKINEIRSAIQSVLDFFNSVKGAISGGLSRVGGFVGGLIPKFATGGIVTGPTLAMIGEAGPEMVVPLDRAGGIGGTSITVNFYGDVLDERALSEVVEGQIALTLKHQLNLGGMRA